MSTSKPAPTMPPAPPSIYQASSEEHFRLAAELHEEYLRWVAGEFRAVHGIEITHDVERAHEQFMAGRSELLPPRGRLYLVEDGGVAAGTGALKPLGNEIAYVKRMYVRPAYRGRGLSRAIVEKLLDDARREGYRQVCLETATFMTVAQRLYRSVGFRARDRFSGSEVPAEHARMAIFMELDL